MPWDNTGGGDSGVTIENYNPEFQTLKAGDVSGGNYFEVEADGTTVANGDSTVWDEISASFVGRNVLTSAGRVDYNFNELTLDFSATARYPNEPVGVVLQLPHARKAGSDIRPHLHWIQTSNNNPNILIEWRWYANGEPVSASWTKTAITSANNVFAWDSPNMQQITSIPTPVGSGADKGISSTFEVKIYRDSNNTSGLFAGNDSYSGTFSVKYYDVHLEKDTNGSREEFVK